MYLNKFLLLITLLVSFAFQNASHGQEELPQELERIRRIVLSRGDDPGAVAYLVQLSRDLSSSEAATLYFQVAQDYLRSAKYNTAGELLRQLVDQHPQEASTRDAISTLILLYSSCEIAHTQQSHRPAKEGNTGFATYALHLAGQSRMKSAELANDPEILLLSAVAARQSGRPQLAQGFLTPLEHNARAKDWHRRALAEEWLQGDREQDPPIAVRPCKSINQRPQLDGILNEVYWSSATVANPQPPYTVFFAYDEEFLYIAAECQKLSVLKYNKDDRPRSYDADLSEHDRLRLRLDLDRDYSTWFELSVDHRGWTAERCWQATSWNPRWYVAANQDGPTWTIELAIPLKELKGQLPTSGDAWAFSLQRVAPGLPAEAEDFELLLFE